MLVMNPCTLLTVLPEALAAWANSVADAVKLSSQPIQPWWAASM